jgi:hypothetical protein
MTDTQITQAHCEVCVYYPPNLPESAYSKEDYRMLQAKTCAFDCQPLDKQCQATRKTSCSLVDPEHLLQR